MILFYYLEIKMCLFSDSIVKRAKSYYRKVINKCLCEILYLDWKIYL